MDQQLLAVRVGPYLFGAPVAAVKEILAKPVVTPIPRTPPMVAGVTVIRGQPLAVLTIRPALQLPEDEVSMVLRWGGDRGAFLIAVDAVESLRTPGKSLPRDTWSTLVPAAIEPWITNAYRDGSEWIWAWAEDLPDRLQDAVLETRLLHS